nr:transmembrane protein 87A [Tanacetum cinerariifolium]
MVESGNCCLVASVERWCLLFRFEEIRFQRPQEASNFCIRMIYAILFEITRTGMYNFYFMHCEPRLNGMIISGKSIWKNPSGYLPGRMLPILNFYGYMSLAFLVLRIFWFSHYARHWKEVLHLQDCITLAITLGMFEMALWYFDYVEFTESGVRLTWTTIWAVTFGTVKRTVSHLIILTVLMGYGVVRPTLGGLTSKVVMLGGTFFLHLKCLSW